MRGCGFAICDVAMMLRCCARSILLGVLTSDSEPEPEPPTEQRSQEARLLLAPPLKKSCGSGAYYPVRTPRKSCTFLTAGHARHGRLGSPCRGAAPIERELPPLLFIRWPCRSKRCRWQAQAFFHILSGVGTAFKEERWKKKEWEGMRTALFRVACQGGENGAEEALGGT